jgi:hypothetical protein
MAPVSFVVQVDPSLGPDDTLCQVVAVPPSRVSALYDALAAVVRDRQLVPPAAVAVAASSSPEGLVRGLVAAMVARVTQACDAGVTQQAWDESVRVAAVMPSMSMKTLYDVVQHLNADRTDDLAVVTNLDAGAVAHLPAGWAYGVYSRQVSDARVLPGATALQLLCSCWVSVV